MVIFADKLVKHLLLYYYFYKKMFVKIYIKITELYDKFSS